METEISKYSTSLLALREKFPGLDIPTDDAERYALILSAYEIDNHYWIDTFRIHPDALSAAEVYIVGNEWLPIYLVDLENGCAWEVVPYCVKGKILPVGETPS